MGFKEGQEVKAAKDISGGMLKPDVKKGQHGVVTKVGWFGVDVQFLKGGWGQPEVKLTGINEDLIEKR